MSELQSYAKAIAKKLKPAMNKAEEPKTQRDMYGVVNVSSSGASVLIDGASSAVKCHFGVNCLDGDRVMCHIVNHSVYVISNLTNPNLSTAEAITHAKTSPNTVVVQNVVLSDSTLQNVDLHGFYATDGTIENTFIKGSDIDGSTFTNGSISGTSIDTSTFTNGSISGTAIDTSTFTNGSISGAAIDASTFTNGSISGAAIDGSTFTNGQISGAAIDSSTLTNIPFASIDDVEIDTAQIKDGAITTAKIKDGDITTAKIGDAQVTNAKIGSAAVGTANIQTAAITTALIANEAVVDSQILSVSANKLTAGTIDASKINVANLKAENLIVRTINGQPVLGGYALIDPSSTGYSSKNPQTEGWYEIANGAYVLTTDTSVVDGKAYYALGTAVMLYDQAYINSLADQLNGRIDGTIESFTGTVMPNLENYPYTDWYKPSANPPVDVRDEHVGDIYYVVNSGGERDGYCYRFAKSGSGSGATYSWVLIKDSDVTAALAYFGDMSTLSGEFTVASFATATATELSNTQDAISTIRTDIGDHSNYTTNTVAQQLYENSATITSLTDTVLHGGENLLSDSASIDLAEPPFSNSTATAYGTTKYGGEQAYYCSGSKYVRVDFSGLTAGDKYTFSFDATRSNAQNVYVTYNGASTNLGKTSSTSGEWKRFSHTFTAVSGQNYILVRVYTTSSTGSSTYAASFRNFKLEYGLIATPWEFDVITTSNTVNTIKQLTDSNTASISSLETVTSNNGLTSSTNITSRVSDVEHDLDGITTRVTRTEGRVIGHYATSETGAGTTAKTATITPTYSGTFMPANDTTVTVKFTYANTATNPTLNVNSSGAKAIKDHDGGEFAANWAAGDEMTFVYDGTCWRADNRSVYSAVSMAESQIKQNADNIELKVSETDVTGNYLIGKINLDATSATISAERVEINGTTIFTAIRSDVEDVAKDAVSDLDQFVRGYAYSPTDDSVAAEGVTYYYRTPTYSEASVTADETDVSDMYELVGWDYVPTADLVAESGKTYYERTPSYEQVSTTAETTDVSGLYELDDGVYVPTEDDVAQSGKPYFRIEDEYEVFPTTAGSTDVTGKFVYTDNASVIGSIGAVNDALSESIEQQGAFNEGVTGQIAGIRSDLRSFVEVEPGDSTATPPVPPSVTVGYMDGDGAYANYRTVVGSDGVDIVNEDGVSVAKYGAEQRLGPVDSPHMVADGDTLMFLPAGATGIEDAAAYIDVDENSEGQLHIARATVDTEMRFGSFAWVKRTNGNLALKWIGE